MNVEELLVKISADIADLKKELQKGKKEVDDFANKSKGKFKEFDEEMKKIGDASKKALKTVAVGIAGAATALLALGASTKEYRTNQAKLNAAFETAGASAEVAKSTYNDLYRVLGDDGQAVEAAQHLAQLTTNSKDLEQWTKITQGVYATFGSSLPIESLTEAANETAKVGTVTGALADALNWAGISEDDFNAKLMACNDEAEREKLIRETLSGIYNTAAENYEKTAEGVLKQNEAQAKLNEATAKLGEAMAPIQTMLMQLASEILVAISPYLQEFGEKHLPKIEEVLGQVAEAIGKVLNWVIDNWDLISTIGTVILAIAAACSVYSTAMAIVNAVMAASPITWIIAAIAALIAIIVLCVKHWDDIKAAGAAAWEWIKNVWNNVANWFNETIVQPIKNFFVGMWDGLVNGAKNAWQGIKNAFGAVANWFKDIFSKAWQAVKNVFSAGGKIFDGIKEGIANVFKTVVNGIIGGINKVIAIPFNAINSALSRIRDIEIVGLKPFSWIKTFTVPQIPKLEKGGILKQGQVGLLEGNGAEAVVPLDKSEAWLSSMADILAKKLGKGGDIILKVDGRELGRAAAKGINNITKTTGSVPLVFA